MTVMASVVLCLEIPEKETESYTLEKANYKLIYYITKACSETFFYILLNLVLNCISENASENIKTVG